MWVPGLVLSEIKPGATSVHSVNRYPTQVGSSLVLIIVLIILLQDDHLVKRLLYSIDNAVRIESFAGSSKETNPVYKDYHGLFHITKLSALYSMVPFVPPSLDLAFKLKRKKFVIEKLHLPPGIYVLSLTYFYKSDRSAFF